MLIYIGTRSFYVVFDMRDSVTTKVKAIAATEVGIHV